MTHTYRPTDEFAHTIQTLREVSEVIRLRRGDETQLWVQTTDCHEICHIMVVMDCPVHVLEKYGPTWQSFRYPSLPTNRHIQPCCDPDVRYDHVTYTDVFPSVGDVVYIPVYGFTQNCNNLSLGDGWLYITQTVTGVCMSTRHEIGHIEVTYPDVVIPGLDTVRIPIKFFKPLCAIISARGSTCGLRASRSFLWMFSVDGAVSARIASTLTH